MGAASPTTSTYLDLTISVPGSSSVATDLKMKPLRLSKAPDPEANWINIGCPNNPNSSEEAEDIDTDSPNPPPRKKLRLSKEQSRLLEDTFRQNHTLNPKQKEELALRLNLKPRQVEVWFQNRRARSKLKQTEVECEYLKRWFGSLSEQNRKLQTELEELRAVKLGPQSAHEPTPGPSISMCPRCERVSSSTAHVDKPTSTDKVETADSPLRLFSVN